MEEHGAVVMIEKIHDKRMIPSEHDNTYSNGVPQEYSDRWPDVENVAQLAGKTEDGREIRIARGLGPKSGEDYYMATINGKEVPPVVAEQLFTKYSSKGELYPNQDAKIKKANREVDAEYAPEGNVAEEELWKDLL